MREIFAACRIFFTSEDEAQASRSARSLIRQVFVMRISKRASIAFIGTKKGRRRAVPLGKYTSFYRSILSDDQHGSHDPGHFD